tara:strand:- start:47 stop:148 length:102 start_codon:yes stop_codon:yes gene_type:complete
MVAVMNRLICLPVFVLFLTIAGCGKEYVVGLLE